MFYAGIGSRNTPTDVLELMSRVARRPSLLGYTLRSGAADGADKAFEAGCTNAGGNKEIFLPWRGFNDSQSSLFSIDDRAFELASTLHPYWHNCSQAAKKLHSRNCYQVLGGSLELPSDFVLCWTQDGCESDDTRTGKTGGTGQAIALASLNNIPVINFKNPNALERIAALIKRGHQK